MLKKTFLLSTTSSFLGLDWGRKTGKCVVHDGADYIEVKDTIEAIHMAHRMGRKLVAEASFESFNPDKRKEAILLSQSLGDVLHTFATRQTYKTRNQLEWGKSDPSDAHLVWLIATRGKVALRPAGFEDPQYIAANDVRKRTYAMMRNRGDLELLADQVFGVVPRVPDEFSVILFQKQKKQKRENIRGSIWTAVAFCALSTTGWRQFEKMAGLYEGAYPSVFRSELYNHGWRHLKKLEGFSPKLFRHAIKWLRKEILKNKDSLPKF